MKFCSLQVFNVPNAEAAAASLLREHSYEIVNVVIYFSICIRFLIFSFCVV